MKFKLIEKFDETRDMVQDYMYDAIDELNNASLEKYIQWFKDNLTAYPEDIEQAVTDAYIEACDYGMIKGVEKTRLTSELKEYIESHIDIIDDTDELMRQCPGHLQHELKIVLSKLDESLTEELLTEKTTTHYELGKHLMADIVNSNSKMSGLRKKIVTSYNSQIHELCRTLTDTPQDAIALFKDIATGDWQAHHINGIHEDNSIRKNPENIALLRESIHRDITNQNYEFIGEQCSRIIPSMHNEELDKLLLRVVVIALKNNIDCNKLFTFSSEGFDTFLTKRMPQMLTDRFYKKFPYSTKDVILLRDLI